MAKVEQGKIADIAGELNTYPNSPDVPKSERCFLPDEFAFVPGFTVSGDGFCSVHE
jgi:hypothetical protein